MTTRFHSTITNGLLRRPLVEYIASSRLGRSGPGRATWISERKTEYVVITTSNWCNEVAPIQQLAIGSARQIGVNVIGLFRRLAGISSRRSLALALASAPAFSFYLGFTGSLQFALVFRGYLRDALFFRARSCRSGL